jgi:hypothetical protein
MGFVCINCVVMNVLEYNGSVICEYNLNSYGITLISYGITLISYVNVLDPCDLRLHDTTRGSFCQGAGEIFPIRTRNISHKDH